ncbi:uncharacterized protein LAESUDRAFT_728892 [Laetiporus sulphureus 93-53]|uniref:Uncharacterized protein n=1 Tax=Laetiporus sulphureus 93-53 TaxID=1314785 RepID=A0A165CWU0_9APHY|nr:uncharacterized protein LAESUDRAFT_728892 [Laetiporus sulphureus 93-53]KZT03614.1 hypothetical protein LAESUDRAFT_728892 [Laetiporus sulphureus 93-53]
MFDPDESWRLESVVDEEYMSGLGRPLLGSRYKSGDTAVREGLIGFAVDKLINRNMSDLLTHNDPNRKLDKELTDAQKFACLSQRLALDFMSTRYIMKEEQEQVASHLRICLNIDNNFKSMKTASASEPMFAEAAYKVMQHFNPVAALLRSLQGLRIHQGYRGELIVLLLLTMARDLAVGPSRLDGRPASGKSGRIFSMTEFIQQLFPRSANTILDARPSRDDGMTHTLRKHIEGSVVHFNHFMQVHQGRMIRRRFIIRSMARGAAILPGSSEPGVDCLFGFCAFGSSMHIGNVGIFMCQDTLGPRYADEPDWSLHDAMDPTKLEMFEEEDDGIHRGADGSVLAPVPVIRVVFALNADESVVVVRPNTGEDPNPLFRTYDIWCAGISKEELGPVNSDNFDSWMALRNRADAWRSTYEEPGVPEEQLELRCMLTPGAAAEEAFFANWAKDHMGIV